MTIEILQGGIPLADRNRTLGLFILDGLPPAPRRAVQVEVTFDIDCRGVMTVFARDLATGNENEVSLEAGENLTARDIENLIADEARFRSNPVASWEATTIRNATRLRYVTQHLLSDLSPWISRELTADLEASLAALQETLRHSPPAHVSTHMSQLIRLLSMLCQMLETGPPLPTRDPPTDASQSSGESNSDKSLTGFDILSVKNGGMGNVAIILKEGRRYAAKTLRDDLLRDRDAVQRFMVEARTWMSLERHTNIVSALLVKEVGGSPLILLEYADGGSLEQWVGKTSVAQALDIGIQICAGMSYAWTKAGIVHRDIKPANVLLTRNSRFRFDHAVKVTDFGLAGTWRPARNEEPYPMSVQLSQGMGTWPYMPPEQFPKRIQERFGYSPESVTPRSDLYSFAILLYELLTGRRPYCQVSDIFTSALADPSLVNPLIPSRLSDLISKCLAKRPRDRHSSFDEVMDELVRIYEQVTSERYVIMGEAEPLTPVDWVTKGTSLITLGSHSEAQQCFEKALASVTDYPPAWHGRGLCLESAGLYNEALRCYDTALQHNPHLSGALCAKARCLIRQGRLGDAVACYERAHESELLTSIGSGRRRHFGVYTDW